MPAGESEDRSKTRERFNEAFRKYTESEKKKSKKRGTEAKETIVLQNLRKNLNLEKDTEDDETILQNTYDPEQGSPRYTKNKRREREITEKVNINNSRNQDEITTSKAKRKSKRDLPSLPVPKDISGHIQEDADASKADSSALDPDAAAAGGKELKRGSKKGKSKESAAESQVEDAEDGLLQEYQQQMAQEEERTIKTTETEKEDRRILSQNITWNNDVGKKKKKKLKSVTTESDVGDQDERVDHDADVENETETRGKKKKKKKKHVVKEESEAEPEEAQNATFDDRLVLGLFVHRTDPLKTDLLMSHPMVKIHVVDEVTGQYVKKEDSHRPVSSYYERENVHYILPIMTQPFDFKKNKSIVPEWQEQIIFNERFGYFVEQNDANPRVVLFFEILDFMTMEEAKANTDADEHERGFRKIAWAFLKLVGTNGVLNVDSKLRLQLFCPLPRAKRQPKTIEVVEWWRKHPRTKYASTLYVTVKGIKLPEHVDPSVRSMMALQEERGSTSYSELQSEVTKRSPTQAADSKQPVLRWSRLPGQMCRVPNKHILAFRGGQMGCFTVLFSHAGTILAAACADRDSFPVVVYEIPSGKVLAAFSGHLKIVYDLCWSRDDRSLLSASSDGTVREWNIERLVETAQKVLPHPSFVYCAQYHPSAQNLAVTGGYDCLIRVWRLDVDDVNGQLLQEFEGHSSFINTVCFDFEGSRMFSADNTGVINVWKASVNDSRHRQKPCHHWCIEKKISESDLSGIPINVLQLHPNGRCLLIHAKDSVLRMMDLRMLAVKKYTGATNYRERIYSTLTPCGTFIFSGSEDGMAYVWNADTGDQVAVYSELCYRTALHGVSFHPHDNMVAFCACGQNQPVHVYLYDGKASQLEMHSGKAVSRSASADRLVRNTPDSLPLQDTSASSALEQFAHTARLSMKRQLVKEHLDSVLEPHRRSSASEFIADHDKMGISQRSYTSDTMGLNASLPHSKLQLSGSLAEQLIPQAALNTQTQGFSSAGQHLKGASSLRQKTTLPDSISSGFYVETDSPPVQQVVVSIYDYKANRSDELTVRRGDVIQVLFKDKENDTWWFGRLVNGLQGYFPASYVVEQSEFREEAAETHSALSERTIERSTPTRVSAAVSSSGELRFLSEPTFSDTEPELTGAKTRRKKKVKKPSAAEADSSGWIRSRRRGRTTDRPLPKRPTGQTNSAFEPDT
ncbi:jouberin isoform X2 [Kryptolebias marmoratus]|uniref:Abelson helper integration site 1 n=1 Tax=Kryptolebias marmoratus TaxID=37003 RepID=A0A3Q3AQN7_KRYMA|nr:jouberin isoform X2 [Kryptolebias marmoratus]